MYENRCDECPVIEKVNTLENDIKQIKSETKENEKAWTKLSGDLNIHMLRSEERSKGISKDIKDLSDTFKKHMEDEEESVVDLKNSIEDFKKDLFNPRDGLFTNLKSNVDDNKFKTKVIWGIVTSIGVSALGVVAYLVRGVM